MAEAIFDDLEKLFSECDEVEKSFHESFTGPSGDTSGNKSTEKDHDVHRGSEKLLNISKTTEYCLTDENNMNRETLEESEHSVRGNKRSWLEFKVRNNQENKMKSSDLDTSEYSKEEGELSTTVNEASDDTVITKDEKKGDSRECSYSTFIDSTKEEGECSTTRFEENSNVTIVELPQKNNLNYSESSDKENHQPATTEKGVTDCGTGNSGIAGVSFLRKRKRSLEGKKEIQTKRHYLFSSEDNLSPIVCSSDEQYKIPDRISDTPLIESKFVFQGVGDICSSTPINTDTFGFPADKFSSNTNTPVKSNCVKKNGKFVFSDFDSDFSEFEEIEIAADAEKAMKPLDDLIKEITLLCEDDGNELKAPQDLKTKPGFDNNQTFSNIEVRGLICESVIEISSEHVVEISSENDSEDASFVEISSATCTENSSDNVTDEEKCADDEHDKTLTENKQDNDNDISENENRAENLTLIAYVKKSKQTEKDKKAETESDQGEVKGRFQGEITLTRVEEGNEGKTGKETDSNVEDDVNDDVDEQELLYGDDILNLDNYDDDGFIDETVLEKTNFVKDKTVLFEPKKETEVKNETEAEVGPEKKTVDVEIKSDIQNVDNLDSVVKSIQNRKEAKVKDEKVKTDVNKNIVDGLDYAVFDTSIYRRKGDTDTERYVCKRWKTKGPPDPDVNLTVSSTFRKVFASRAIGGPTPGGFLEGERLVGTHFYEECGVTAQHSNMCYMTVEKLLGRLYKQKEVLESLKYETLSTLKRRLSWQMSQIQNRHCDEMQALRHRQKMEKNRFVGDPWSVAQLIEEHRFQCERMKDHHQREFTAVRQRGRDVLDEEMYKHTQQCKPVQELIDQLEQSDSNSSHKYGPPIMVSLRKGPCKASNGKHTNVSVCLSAGIAQAVSLEDDLYDHYYSY